VRNLGEAARDHLFISYATEDSILADWLSLKLASEGYNIWYDRIKMLGGESYPRDITKAIKNKTYRVIALLSKSSISKPNPVKERTLALNIAKEREIEDFLIPLNVDGLKPTELDFMTSDLVFISFYRGWYDGLSRLLKKLEEINTPKNQISGREAIGQWLSSEELPANRTETQWSNLLPILEFPSVLWRYKVVPEVNVESIEPDWLAHRESESTILAFSQPSNGTHDWLKEVEAIDYRNSDSIPVKDLRQALTMILRKGLRNLCIQKGLRCDEPTGRLYFPPELLPNNRLSFNRYDGKSISLQAVGERNFWVRSQGRAFTETSRYHISPDFRFFLDLLGDPVLRLRIGIFWTDLEGRPLEAKKANRRRKKLCKNWWNYQWLSRVLAVTQWLGSGLDEVTLLETDSGRLRVGLKPVTFTSGFGIDETKLKPLEPEVEEGVIEDNEEGSEEDADTDSA
jgi:hypothetical protein